MPTPLIPHEGYITIAVDAMGGDYAPAVVVEGALSALATPGHHIAAILVGRQEQIERELARFSAEAARLRNVGRLNVVHAPDVIEMHDLPNAALKTKRKSSISIGLEIHKEGKAQGFVSAGNTGAVLSASTLILGRLKGVARPTIGALIPTADSPCLLIDSGTNVDCQPRHLYEFGVMGSLYVSTMLGKSRPKVALLSIGEEETKGNEVSIHAYELLKKSELNFVGNVEGRDVLRGEVDVVVCDGFVGNILLKFGESVPSFLKAKFLRYAKTGLLAKLSVLVARSGMRSVLKDMDYQEQGGVPLLGVNGVSIIGHGGSTPKAIKNMILRAEEMVQQRVHHKIQEILQAQSHGVA